MQFKIIVPDVAGLFAKFPVAVTRAARKAGSSAIRVVRVESTRAVRARKQIRVRAVRSALTVSRGPAPGASLEKLEWKMFAKDVGTRISDYPYRQVRAGVRVGINKGEKSLIKSAFVATMKSGHTGVFKREGTARLGIKELFTTRVADIFRDSGMMPKVEARATAEFSSTFNRVLPMELKKVGSKQV